MRMSACRIGHSKMMSFDMDWCGCVFLELNHARDSAVAPFSPRLDSLGWMNVHLRSECGCFRIVAD